MIKDNDLKILSQWGKHQNEVFEILLATHDTDKAQLFEEFAFTLETATTWIRFLDTKKNIDTIIEENLPGFILGANIFYSALPLDKEFEPFLKAMEYIKSPFLYPKLIKYINQILTPCTLTLFITKGCPHCPGVANTLMHLAAQSNNIKLHIIDASLFPEIAIQKNVMSAPCLILNDDFRWTGTIKPEEILDMILKQDPARFETKKFKKILENGQAQWITKKMIQEDKWFKGFLELLVHETWAVRLGAMVIVEEISETHPKLAQDLAPFCMEMFCNKSLTIQGDLLYVLGLVGKTDEKNWIQSQIKTMNNPELIEAAEEAMNEIGCRINSPE